MISWIALPHKNVSTQAFALSSVSSYIHYLKKNPQTVLGNKWLLSSLMWNDKNGSMVVDNLAKLLKS